MLSFGYCGRLERNVGCFDEDLDLDPIFMIQRLYNFGHYLKEFCFLTCKMEVAIITVQGQRDLIEACVQDLILVKIKCKHLVECLAM